MSEEKKEKQKENKRRCSKCNSLLTYLRFKTNELACRNCGYIQKLEEKR